MITEITKKEGSTMIRVSNETKRRLLRLKGEFGVETYDRVVSRLIDFYEERKGGEA